MAELLADLTLEPKDAVAFFRAKGEQLAWDYTEVWREQNVHAFTVAKATTTDVLHTIRAEVDKAISTGQTFEDFKRTLRPRLQELGWWGQQEVLDGETGELTQAQLGSTRRLRTIYQTNVQTAYMAGRYKRYLENVDARPYWRYVAIMDSRTRPTHSALNGKVWRWDDPIWQVIWPPNGWGCRCRVMALSEAEFRALGVPLEDGRDAIDTSEVTINKAGDKVTVQGVRYTDELGRQKVFRPDPGWDYNPGAEFVRRTQMLNLFADKVRRVPAWVGAQVASDLMASDGIVGMLDQAWRAWVAEVMTDPLARKREMVVGFLRVQDVEALAERGVAVENVAISVQDSRLVGKKAERHLGQGNAMSEADWLALSGRIRQPQAVLWQPQGQRLLYVLPADAGQAQRVVIDPNYMQRGKPAADNLRTAYWSDVEDLRRDVRGGVLELIEGEL